jgi:hypothetical protein
LHSDFVCFPSNQIIIQGTMKLHLMWGLCSRDST